jgi:enamine deaminase RidA (YjgF/YER057c/UK114 family)
MADHTIRKCSRSAVGYSVVSLNDVQHLYAAAAPRQDGTFEEQARDALLTIASVINANNGRGSIVQQAVFLADMTHRDRCRQIIADFYGRDIPVTSYIPQSPCGGRLLAIEALGVGQGNGEVQIERIGEELVIARHNGIAWVHAALAAHDHHGAAYCDATAAMRHMRSLLGQAGVRYDDIIRTWFYLGGITEKDGSEKKNSEKDGSAMPGKEPVERYQELNRARADFYRDIRFLPGRAPAGRSCRVFPASTGIGTSGRGVVLGAIALASDRKDIRAVPLENPRQTAAYDYASAYSAQSPKFSRAMALSCGTYATIFISGTASITDSQTRHAGDAPAQTEETLDNIAALISEENLCRHGLPGLGASLASLAFARVYIKRGEDYPAVREICERRLGGLPTIYAQADVCRPDLLVEIEGMAFSRLFPLDARKEDTSDGRAIRSLGADD